MLTPIMAFTADETDHGSSDHTNGGLLEAMGLNLKLIITQAAGFLIVLFVLNKLVFGKVGGILADRQSEIVSRMNKLETDQAELDRLTAETTQRLNQIEAEAQQKIRTAIDQGNEERQQIL
ncbi:MAG: ATP synthase F0 subunit B, partial [Candidatus Poribacteria bacterium]|nr:ATP synthase F0 subunit B [Candidatus Poribacteria bacterium]